MPQQINWAFCQSNSDQLLAEALSLLRNQPLKLYSHVAMARQGNYLISLDGEPFYIGEAKALSARLKLQFNERTSTFYKTFVGAKKYGEAPLGSFRVQCIETSIGRKEFEEFGIVNLPTKLNKFQLGKRFSVALESYQKIWVDVQALSDSLLAQGEKSLWEQEPVLWFDASISNRPGIYVVWNDGHDEPLYIGESSNIAERYTTHSRHTYFSALRRHIGTEILGFSLRMSKGRPRLFAEDEDERVTNYLRSSRLAFLPISFGRYELEEFLIRKHHPYLNRKENKATSS